MTTKKPDTAKLRALHAAASPRWSGGPIDDVDGVLHIGGPNAFYFAGHMAIADAEFAAAAHEQAPALCERVEALEAALRNLVNLHDTAEEAADEGEFGPPERMWVDALDDAKRLLGRLPAIDETEVGGG